MVFKNCRKSFSLVLSIVMVLTLFSAPIFSLKPQANTVDTVDSKSVFTFEDNFDSLQNGNIHGQNGWYSVWTGAVENNASHKVNDGVLSVYDYSNGGDSFAERHLKKQP